MTIFKMVVMTAFATIVSATGSAVGQVYADSAIRNGTSILDTHRHAGTRG
jgi:hypothetical protein